MQTIPVYVDQSFTDAERADIHQALDEWTYALNGYARYTYAQDRWDPEDEATLGKIARTHQGLLFFKRTSDDPVAALTGSGVMAWVKMGRPVVNVVTDRIGNRNLKAIMMHEIAHTWGVGHIEIPNTLVYPYYDSAAQCIDQLTARAVAAAQERWDWRRMNYCAGATQ